MSDARRSSRARWGLVGAVALLVVGAALMRWEQGGAPSTPPSSLPSEPAASEVSPPIPSAPRPARVAAAPDPAGDALSEALHEERVSVPSGLAVASIETDRAWVCAGEAMALSAHVVGDPPRGTVYRWVWPTPGGAELQPGPALRWRAPERPGRYVVRFQACRDLGGRRVGVLAEQEVAIDVRTCAEGERQADEPLRIELAQLRHGAFTFRAVTRGRAPIRSYAWDFGDGTTATTTEPQVEHAYSEEPYDPNVLTSFTVKLRAATAGGPPLEATAFALTRGQPGPEALPAVELSVSRWHPRPDGSGLRSDVVLTPTSSAITWEEHERVTQYWDGRVGILVRPWREALHVVEELGGGGLRGHVTVTPSESASDVKQVLDALHGRDAEGQPVVVRWSPYKSEAPPAPLEPEDAPPPAK